MKRNVILAVVAIAALALAGMGGLFADFSDIEISQDNFFEAGSLDLAVSNYLGTEYNGGIVPAFFEVSAALPCCDKSVFLDLENWGNGFQTVPRVYIHFKNFECGWVMPKYIVGTMEPKWITCEDGECVVVDPPAVLPIPGYHGTGLPKPVTEPELVAECGGIAGEDEDGNLVIVDGLGCCFGDGDGCELAEHIDVAIAVMGPWPHELKPKENPDLNDPNWVQLDLSDYDKNGDGDLKLNELECEEIELGKLPYCNGIWVHIMLHLQDIDEEDVYAEGLIPETYFDDTIPAEAKWDHWPTNAIQADYVGFDMAFELLQNPLP
jgi:hypothetical protein